jgi:hypothetical protein
MPFALDKIMNEEPTKQEIEEVYFSLRSVSERYSIYGASGKLIVKVINYWMQCSRDLAAAQEEIERWEQSAYDKLSEMCNQIEKTQTAIAERDKWKASHDNQVELNRLLRDRPDLKERAALVHKLITQRDMLAAALEDCREDSVELLGERDWWKLENRCRYQERYQTTHDNVTRADALIKSLTKL